jgi:hypothetical protein
VTREAARFSEGLARKGRVCVRCARGADSDKQGSAGPWCCARAEMRGAGGKGVGGGSGPPPTSSRGLATLRPPVAASTSALWSRGPLHLVRDGRRPLDLIILRLCEVSMCSDINVYSASDGRLRFLPSPSQAGVTSIIP